ncbi:hypothetical protein HY635_00895 [Candidatus Uhrbacteria bacterium]|nr:hypothetical protein [Candidatus Uhrbacteria bacterium]
MSKQDSWYTRLAELASQYDEDVVRAAEQHLGTHFAERPREDWLVAVEHLAALRVALGSWEAVERTARTIASGRPPNVATEPQRAALAIVPGTGRRRGHAAIVIEAISPTAGYAALAMRCSDAISISPDGQRALSGAGIRFIYELVRKTVGELGRIDGLAAEDLTAIVRLSDRLGLPLGSQLDRGVITRVEEMLAGGK